MERISYQENLVQESIVYTEYNGQKLSLSYLFRNKINAPTLICLPGLAGNRDYFRFLFDQAYCDWLSIVSMDLLWFDSMDWTKPTSLDSVITFYHNVIMTMEFSSPVYLCWFELGSIIMQWLIKKHPWAYKGLVWIEGITDMPHAYPQKIIRNITPELFLRQWFEAIKHLLDKDPGWWIYFSNLQRADPGAVYLYLLYLLKQKSQAPIIQQFLSIQASKLMLLWKNNLWHQKLAMMPRLNDFALINNAWTMPFVDNPQDVAKYIGAFTKTWRDNTLILDRSRASLLRTFQYQSDSTWSLSENYF